MTLAFNVLLNRCIENHDETPKNWNINYDSHLQRRPREKCLQTATQIGTPSNSLQKLEMHFAVNFRQNTRWDNTQT